MWQDFHKPTTFLYTNNKHTEKEIMGTLPFRIVSTNIKYLGINPTKAVKGLYDEYFKPPKKDLEKDNENICHIHGFIEIIM